MESSGPISGLSTRAEKLIRVLSTLTVLSLAIAAAILSFSGLQQLSLKAGISHSIAWLLPVVIDGMVLTGSLGVVSSSLVGMGTWYPWTLTTIGVVASVAGNVAIAHPDLSSRLVHSAGPITFALSIEGLLRIYRASALATAHRERARLAREEAEFEKQVKKEEREAKKQARLLEASLNPTASSTLAIPASAPVVTPIVATPTQPVASIASSTPEVPTAPSAKPASTLHKVGATKERVIALLDAEPDISGAEVARRLDLDDSYARKTLRDIRRERENNLAKVEPVIVEPVKIVEANKDLEIKATEVTPSSDSTNTPDSDPFAEPEKLI